MIRPLAIVACAALAAVALAPPAAAQPSPEARAKAEMLFRAGENAYEAGRYMEAAIAFEDAWSTLPLPAIAFSAAQAYRLQYFVDKKPGGLKRAVELYRTYLDKMPEGGRREDAVASLAELEPLLARLEAEQRAAGRGPVQAERMVSSATRIMVSTPVEGARVSLDGGALVAAPLIQEVAPGEHRVRVEADGYVPVERAVPAAEGEFNPFEIQLAAKPARVRVRADAGADVAIDGRPAGTTPLSRAVEVPAGKHLVTVSRRGRHAWSREIDVARGEQVELQAELDSTGQRLASYFVLGAAGVTVAGAGLYALAALGDDGDASELDRQRKAEGLSRQQAEQYRALVDSRDDNLTTTYALLGIGGALAVTGGLMYFLDVPRAETQPGAFAISESVAVAPVAAPGIAGLAVAGAF